MYQNQKSVTLLRQSTDQLLTVHIITESSSVMTNELPETCRGLYVRLGRSVLLSDAMFSTSAVPLLNTLRNMLMALHVCLKFFQLDLPARFTWQVKTQLWGLSKLTKKKYSTASLTTILSDLQSMQALAKLPILYFPSKFYLDTSASIADMAKVILIMNYHYMISMQQVTTEKSMIPKTTIQYDPVEIANNLKKNGGFIPGFRPGKPTAQFIQKVINKIVVFGAVYLGIVAMLPIIAGDLMSGFNSLAIGGTSVIIVVGVALETVKALEAQMLMRHYKGFLD